MIRRRTVYHIAGFDPVGRRWYRLFARELKKFVRTWSVTSELSAPKESQQNSNSTWTITTCASNWRVETNYVLLLWDDIIDLYQGRSMAFRLGQSFLAFLNFVSSGAVFRYVWANWKYAAFFLFPYFFVCVFAASGYLTARLVAEYFGLSGTARFVVVIPITAGVFVLLLKWLGRRWHVSHSLDDWIFSRDYLRGRRSDLQSRIVLFAENLIAQARKAEVDEIVIVGHSMGATFAIEMIACAIDRDPELGRHGPTICLLTVGSTLPKFTLHPAGDRVRSSVAKIAAEPLVTWAEFYARADVISFYKFDASSGAHVEDSRTDRNPILRLVQVHHMLEPHTMRSFFFKFMRRHYQWVMGNELRAAYDYFMLVCGPIPFARLVKSRTGPMDLFAPNGDLIEDTLSELRTPLNPTAVSDIPRRTG
jgi:pimeloyl-ACP methyl ester carboxylesterase